MTTANKICEGALELIGAHSQVKKATGATFQRMFATLLGVLNTYAANGTAIPLILPTNIADDLEEPAQITEDLKYIVAVLGAPKIQKGSAVTQELRALAKVGRQNIRNQYGPEPGQCFPDTTPIGSGNKTYPQGPSFYPEDDTVDETSGAPITT